jgi:4-hydroxybenzoate polyprenyltransferase/phosphoserine phosphatase
MAPIDPSSFSTRSAASCKPAVFVDLDGTLTLTDTLVESVLQLIKEAPLNVFKLLWWLLQGRATLKAQVASHTRLAVESLPYNEPLLQYLRQQKEAGRRLVLATAAHESIALGVAAHLKLFDDVLATRANNNLKGQAKLQAIEQQAKKDFVYAGDSRADLPIWAAAKAAILVGVKPQLAASVRRLNVPVECEFQKQKSGLLVWMRALRVHQWLKNLLLLVPLLTAFSFTDISKLTLITLAFFAFSLAASATYVVNDLWDLSNDRAHPRKRMRPFAAARLSIVQGLVAAALSLLLGLALAALVSKAFFLMLLLYLVLTSAYSWVLKRYVLLDVLMLSALYTLRILAGAIVIGVPTSSWLIAFSAFIFLSLALVKRCAELVSLERSGLLAARGRDYRVSDLAVLWPLGVGAALCSVLVLGLFIAADETQSKYASAPMLWLMLPGLTYWLARLWIKTSRGQMHDDPIVFAVKDKASCWTVLYLLLIMLAAHFLVLDFLQ